MPTALRWVIGRLSGGLDPPYDYDSSTHPTTTLLALLAQSGWLNLGNPHKGGRLCHERSVLPLDEPETPRLALRPIWNPLPRRSDRLMGKGRVSGRVARSLAGR